jgi:hypothetical protein
MRFLPFGPRLSLSLGCASARKPRLGRKRCTFWPRYTNNYSCILLNYYHLPESIQNANGVYISVTSFFFHFLSSCMKYNRNVLFLRVKTIFDTTFSAVTLQIFMFKWKKLTCNSLSLPPWPLNYCTHY